MILLNDDSNSTATDSTAVLIANTNLDPITFTQYKDESQLPDIMSLISKDLSEPYSIFTYRYFLFNWPQLAYLAHDINGTLVGVVVAKLDTHKERKRGYIAMLAVDARFRKRGIGSKLVQRSIQSMVENEADEVVLEAEASNLGALALYEHLGFIRHKRMHRYYLTGIDAFRLKLWLK
ncbi:acyl-CoA N-acyltransferase [Neoconidiobolus thromboides FSU 785]|nr:acyl-CoA N-acyltransferase [Neoconidiobolus thromboides FSU 785]